MFIIFETVASNDPRLDAKIQSIGKFWHYVIGYVAPEDESSVVTAWLKGEEITEAVAKAALFCSAYNGELSVLANEDGTIANNTITPTSGGDGFWKKAAYFLTESDKQNAIACMQAAMRLFTRDHLGNKEVEEQLLEQINGLDPNDLDNAQMFMATYFDYDTAYTNGKPKPRLFPVTWVW